MAKSKGGGKSAGGGKKGAGKGGGKATSSKIAVRAPKKKKKKKGAPTEPAPQARRPTLLDDAVQAGAQLGVAGRSLDDASQETAQIQTVPADHEGHAPAARNRGNGLLCGAHVVGHREIRPWIDVVHEMVRKGAAELRGRFARGGIQPAVHLVRIATDDFSAEQPGDFQSHSGLASARRPQHDQHGRVRPRLAAHGSAGSIRSSFTPR